MLRLPPAPVFVAVCLVLGLAACADDDTAADPTADATVPTTAVSTSTTSSPTTAPAPTPTPEQEVEAAYRRAFTAYFNAGIDPKSPNELSTHFAGQALAAVEANIERLVQAGQRSDFPTGLPQIAVDSVEIEGAQSATLTACLVDQGRKIVVADGSITDDLPTSRLTSARLDLSEGSWRVIAHQTLTEWANASGCDQ